jgi:hypothetical protein
MSTGKVSAKRRTAGVSPGADGTPQRKRSKSVKPASADKIKGAIIHAPAVAGSEMVLIPVRVLPKEMPKAEPAETSSEVLPRAARRAAKKASRLRRRARRYAAKAKGAVVSSRTRKRTRKVEKPNKLQKPVMAASLAIEEAPKPKAKQAKAKTARTRRTRMISEERTGWLPRPLRSILVSTFVLLVLMLVGGVVYIFMTGGSAAPVTITTTPASATEPTTIKPRQVSPNAPESAAVQMISSPVRPGGAASISVKTLPGSACTIAVTYTDKKVSSTAAGLPPATADDFGTVSWDWVVDTWAPDGTWPATVTCAHNKKSAMVQASLQVSRSAPAG